MHSQNKFALSLLCVSLAMGAFFIFASQKASAQENSTFDALQIKIQQLSSQISALKSVIDLSRASAYAYWGVASGGNDTIRSYSANIDPVGYFDGADCNIFAGWACDANSYNQPTIVHFYADGMAGKGGIFIGATTANVTREAAVGKLCGGYNNHSFSYVFPNTLKDGKQHTIYAYAINTPTGNNPLLGTNAKKITCTISTPIVPICGNNKCESGEADSSASKGTCPQDCCDAQVNEQINMLQAQLAAVNAQLTQNSSASTNEQLKQQISILQAQLLSLKTNCKNTNLTCSQVCQTSGSGSYCNAWAVGTATPAPNTDCKSGETNFGWTSDCTAAGITGGGRACCCKTTPVCGNGICEPGETDSAITKGVCPQDCTTLTVSLDANTPKARNIIADKNQNITGAAILLFDVRSKNDISVDGLKANFSITSASTKSTAYVAPKTAYLYDSNGTLIGMAAPDSNGVTNFINLNYPISKNTTKVFTIKIDDIIAKPSNTTHVSNEDAQKYIVTVPAGGIAFEQSGSLIQRSIGSAVSNPATAYAEGPIFTLININIIGLQPTGGQSGKASAIFNIQIKAPSGDVYVPKNNAFSVDYGKDGVDVGAASWSGYIQPAGTVADNNTTGNGYFKVPEGTTVTFSVTANITPNNTTGGNYDLRMQGITWSHTGNVGQNLTSNYMANDPDWTSAAVYLGSAPAPVVCGNGTCESGENSTTCPQDCCNAQVNEQIALLQAQLATLNTQLAQNSSASTNEQLKQQISILQAQLSSLKTNCKNTNLTCSQVCQTSGSGYCNAWATGTITPAPNTGCKSGETDFGWTSDCTAAGIIGGGRACCCKTTPFCGNGTCEAGENAANCAADCSNCSSCLSGSTCQNGVCVSDCTGALPVGNKKIFVTSNSYYGNQLGSETAADALCQTAAANAGDSGTFKALTYIGNRTPGSILTGNTYENYQKSGSTCNWNVIGANSNFANGNLTSPIQYDEWGKLRSTKVWTDFKLTGSGGYTLLFNTSGGTVTGANSGKPCPSCNWALGEYCRLSQIGPCLEQDTGSNTNGVFGAHRKDTIYWFGNSSALDGGWAYSGAYNPNGGLDKCSLYGVGATAAACANNEKAALYCVEQ